MSRPLTMPEGLHSSSRRKIIDWWLVAASGLLLFVGLMSLFSIDRGGNSRYFLSQGVKVVIGIVPFAAMFFVHPNTLRKHANLLYAASLMCLGLVFLAGKNAKGAQRWIDLGPIEFQPSELAKLLLAITLAAFFANRPGECKSLKTYVLSLMHLLPPLLLVLKQPHLGGSLTLVVIWLGISFVAGVPPKFLAVTLAGISCLLVGAYYAGALPDYQLKRVKSFVLGTSNKDSDARYHQERALISFGSGGLSGQGFLKGEHKGTGFVPEQQTDYISTVIGEEGGLIGCTLLLGAFGFLLYRIWLVMFQAVEPFFKLVVAGILSYIAFHIVANLGMNLEMLPVVGLWLPFLSYGGTALWLCMASIALVLNIRSREPRGMFDT